MTATPLPTVAEQARPSLLDQIAWIAALLRDHRDQTRVAPPRPAAPLPVHHVAVRLGLSEFERDVLMLVAAAQLDGEVAALVGEATGGAPSFALALAVLPDPHWDAILPTAALRSWGLIELGGASAAASLAQRPLALPEPVLHHLAGLGTAASLLGGLARPSGARVPLTASQADVADRLAGAVAGLAEPALVRLSGPDAGAVWSVAERLVERLGGVVMRIADAALPELDLAAIARRVDLAARLEGGVPVTGHSGLISLLDCPLAVTLGVPPTDPGVARRVVLAEEVPLPLHEEQAGLWAALLPAAADDPAMRTTVADLGRHFRLSAQQVRTIAVRHAAGGVPGPDELRSLTREHARLAMSALGGLAERIEPRAAAEDLVLPAGQLLQIEDLIAHLGHRDTVYDDWGFAQKSARGLGITALFAGESGTGKTMAAEVVAGRLGLDLFRIDLSAVVSKYIGETEEHLRGLFDAAEVAGAVLLFDEADALFGKRTEVKDSHDRYANLEIAYLLQRMDSYRGVAILTSNLKANVDAAFTRRLRFVVHFPFPDEAARAEIWRRVLPDAAPTEALDPQALAKLQISGGTIRAIALGAAFVAAAQGRPIGPEHVRYAAGVEYAKTERSVTSAELAAIGGTR